MVACGIFVRKSWTWHNQKRCVVAAELAGRLLSNPDGGIESVLYNLWMALAFKVLQG